MGNMMSMPMMDLMAAHMRGMDTASAANLQSMVPRHRQMAANMVSQINSDMRGMNMPGDARWTALTDSAPGPGAPARRARGSDESVHDRAPRPAVTPHADASRHDEVHEAVDNPQALTQIGQAACCIGAPALRMPSQEESADGTSGRRRDRPHALARARAKDLS